jgi:hypothetical protein
MVLWVSFVPLALAVMVLMLAKQGGDASLAERTA